MKQLVTLCLFLTTTFLLNAVNIWVPSSPSPYNWTTSNELGAISSDKIIVESARELIINYPAAPNVDIVVQKGGTCTINSFNATGTITVESGGTLNITPINNSDIVIGHNIIFEEFIFPVALTDMGIVGLISSPPAFSNFNIKDNSINYPKIQLNGSLELNAGSIFKIDYPAAQTNKLEFDDMQLHAIAIPVELVPIIKGLLPAAYAAYDHLVDPGVIPPLVTYTPGAQFPTVNTMAAYFKVLEVGVSVSSPYRSMASMAGITIPSDDTYLTKDINLGAYNTQAPASYSNEISITVEVPVTDDYTIKFPQLTTTTGKTWYLYDGVEKKFDLSATSATDRTLSAVTLATGSPITQFSFKKEDVETSLSTIDAANEVLSIEYFTISGQRVQKPESGIYIIKTIYTNGQVETKKVF